MSSQWKAWKLQCFEQLKGSPHPEVTRRRRDKHSTKSKLLDRGFCFLASGSMIEMTFEISMSLSWLLELFHPSYHLEIQEGVCVITTSSSSPPRVWSLLLRMQPLQPSESPLSWLAFESSFISSLSLISPSASTTSAAFRISAFLAWMRTFSANVFLMISICASHSPSNSMFLS